MEIKYSKIVARDVKEAVIEIYGEIGQKVNGDYLASEINYLGKSVDVITFRINSIGGNVLQGLSIIGAIVASPAKTVAIVEGIAGSMSGVIALSCQKVKMNDFARIMLHAPYMVDPEGNEVTKLTKEEKASVKHMTGMLTDLLTRRGKNQEDITNILKTDTWYTAQEALKEQFIDEVIETGVAAAAAELTIDKLVAFASDKFLTTNTDMKKIAAKLGLAESSDETAIIAAIDKKETDLASDRKALLDAVIAAGKLSGVVNDQNVASMTKVGQADLTLLVDLVIKPVKAEDNTRLSDVIAKVDETLSKLESKETKEEKKWNEFNQEELNEMKASDLPKFKKLYKDYWKQEWK
jgi:ATP-dependent protease ClpP protease subunit